MNVTFLKNKPDEESMSSRISWIKICERLLDSDNEAVKIEAETSEKAKYAYRTVLGCIKAHGYPLQLRVTVNNVFILKKDKEQIDE